jgi:hypothetical protein
VLLDIDGSNERFIGPSDDAARFDAEFLGTPDRLVLTSTRGGIHNLEILDLQTTQATPLTRMLSAAVAPAATPGGEVFFLALHSRGWDMRRIAVREGRATPIVSTDPGLSPAAATPSQSGSSLTTTNVEEVRGYGLGPRFILPLPLLDGSVAGWSAGFSIRSTDPIGIFAWQLKPMYGSASGSAGNWRGASAEVLWRGFRPWLRLQGFFLDGPIAPGVWGGDYIGGLISAEYQHTNLGSAHRFKAGGSVGRLDSDRDRSLGFAEYGVGLLQTRGTARFTQSLGAHLSAGRTGDTNWTRWRISGAVGMRLNNLGISVSGQVAGSDAPAYSDEELSVGGTEFPLFDPAITSFRMAMPALEVGTLRGDRIRTLRVDFDAGLPFSTFLWTGDAAGDSRGWYRVGGIEFDESLPEMSYLRLPGVRARLGIAHMFSNPNEGDWRAWAVLSYRP